VCLNALQNCFMYEYWSRPVVGRHCSRSVELGVASVSPGHISGTVLGGEYGIDVYSNKSPMKLTSYFSIRKLVTVLVGSLKKFVQCKNILISMSKI
jgi:hypothetical protein